MENFIELRSEDMAGKSFECKCGLTHSVDLQSIIVSKDALGSITAIAKPFSEKGKIYVISDNNTYAACGADVIWLLNDSGYDIKSFMFETRDHQLNPDEKTLGRLIYEIEPDVSLIVAVGSGVINDICRTISFKMKVPFVIVGTAPSMDGYASRGTPLIIDGFKLTHYDHYPHAIVCDIDIMKNAPMIMLQAGFGDIIGKLTAISDWNLSRIIKGEHYCDICAGMMINAVDTCIRNAHGIVKREDAAISGLIDALIMAGIAMGIYTSTRPASSTEHYFAHYWDVDAIKRGVEHPLHGISVGVGTVVACEAYDQLKDRLPNGLDYPKTDHVLSLFEILKAPVSPKQIGIDRDLFRRSVIHCIDDRPKYGILHLARELGRSGELADVLTEKFYG